MYVYIYKCICIESMRHVLYNMIDMSIDTTSIIVRTLRRKTPMSSFTCWMPHMRATFKLMNS